MLECYIMSAVLLKHRHFMYFNEFKLESKVLCWCFLRKPCIQQIKSKHQYCTNLFQSLRVNKNISHFQFNNPVKNQNTCKQKQSSYMNYLSTY